MPNQAEMKPLPEGWSYERSDTGTWMAKMLAVNRVAIGSTYYDLLADISEVEDAL